MVLSVVSLVGYLISIIVFGVSQVLGSCSSSNDTPGCSSNSGIYRALGAVTIVIIVVSVGLTCFGIYLFWRFGREFGVSPYKRQKNQAEPPFSATKSISVHHDEVMDDMKDFV